jgi:hypothetical protein
MNDSVVGIVSAFFIIGIAVGIIAVVAMSVLRADRRERLDHEPGEQPSHPRWDDAGPDDHPRWPGSGDTYFSGR